MDFALFIAKQVLKIGFRTKCIMNVNFSIYLHVKIDVFYWRLYNKKEIVSHFTKTMVALM